MLFISPYTPVAIRTRPHHFLRTLVARGHDLTLATLYENGSEQAYLGELESAGVRVVARPASRWRALRQVAAALAAGVPMQARYNWDGSLAAEIARLHAEHPFQVAHIEHLRGAVYGVHIGKHVRTRLPVVWDSVDSISHLFSQSARQSESRFGRFAGRLELRRTRRYEAEMVRRFNRILVTSAQDRQALLELSDPAAESKIAVLPNGVDTERFFPIDGPSQPDTIIFTGKMSYHANITAVVRFVREVLPLIQAHKPEMRFEIVGKDPARQIRKLGEADERIHVVGTVPDLRPYLAAAAVSVAPIAYGAGIQNKVLEAMACRVPVVASPQAVQALDAVPGRDVLVADDAEAFAGEILRLLGDEALRLRIAAAGYQYVLENHRWEEAASRLEDVYDEAIRSAL
ncbi:MAG TPA: glycosyltransferase [Anaerolineales bacterium]|nr:glycosyltransferase [Anaerolineales bacterium]